jgi:hypothetical protein
MNQLASVFVDAALPQKGVFVVLGVSILVALMIAARDVARARSASRRSAFISELRSAGPALGLLTASLDAFHMAQTTLRLPYPPTPAMLAPGVMEIAALAGLGAVAGLVAVALHSVLGRRRSETQAAGRWAPAAAPGQ